MATALFPETAVRALLARRRTPGHGSRHAATGRPGCLPWLAAKQERSVARPSRGIKTWLKSRQGWRLLFFLKQPCEHGSPRGFSLSLRHQKQGLAVHTVNHRV